jgi:hypothetical protein
VKSTTCPDGLLHMACETLILSAILPLANDGEEGASVESAHHRQCLEGEPRSGGPG